MKSVIEFKAAGLTWAALESGPVDAPLVLLLHGTLAGKEMFASLVEALGDRFRTVALDWPGHGGTTWNEAGWTPYDLVEAMPHVIGALGSPQATLVGLSQGGAIGLRAALAYPEAVSALVTMGAGPDGPSPEVAAGMATLGDALAAAPDPAARRALFAARQPTFHTPGWVSLHPDAAARELDIMVNHPAVAMPHVTRLPGQYDDITARLPGIACPTLVVWGSDDARVFWGEPMVAAIDDARLEIVADAGHHLPWDQPDEVNRLIGAFLDEVLAGQVAPPT